MSEANDIIQAISEQLQNYSTLNYIKSWTEYEDELSLEDKANFPYVNFDLTDFRVERAGTLSEHQAERRIYPVIIMFSNWHKEKVKVKEGKGSFKGLFDIYDDIKAAIYQDLTFGEVVNKYPFRPDFATDISKHPNGEFWIGRAVIFFEVYKDVFFC